jgi:hypothetical protein
VSCVVSSCRCAEHVGDLTRVVVPFASSARGNGGADSPVTIGDLIEWEALGAELEGGDPDRWVLWFGDECRAHYDDNALSRLEDAVAATDGMYDVVREDRETVLVSSKDRCADGMLAVAARALLDDRVRLTSL